MDLEHLTAQFTDFLRPNLFEVYIFPKTNFANFDDDGIGVLCNEASLPFYTFTTTDMFYNNKNYSFVNKIDFDPISISFYVDKFNKVLKFFDLWKNQIIDENYQFGYYDDYISQIMVNVLDTRGEFAVTAILHDAFLLNINPINLAFSESDAVMHMQASFKFNHIDYFFHDRAKQEGPMQWIKDSGYNWLTLANLRRGINLVEKLKNYRHMIKNGNVYDLISEGGNVFNTVFKGARQGSVLNGITGIVKKNGYGSNASSSSSTSIVKKASDLFN